MGEKKELLVTLLKQPFYKEMGLQDTQGEQFNDLNKEELSKFYSYVGENAVLIPRNLADGDPNFQDFKQIIPYSVIVNSNTQEVFAYKRLDGSGEKKLVGSLSIGVGGHANPITKLDRQGSPVNESGETIIVENAIRELYEEVLGLKHVVTVKILGLINDDTPESVGVVHTGLLNVIEVNDMSELDVGEPDNLQKIVLTFDQLLGLRDELESWSRIVLEPLKIYFGNNSY